MRKTITIAAYNRPDNLRMLLDSLRAQLLPFYDYSVIVSVDAGGDKFAEVMDVAKTIDFAPSQVFHSASHLGLNHNTYWPMEHVFDVLGADWNVYLEDDLVLSPDAFNLVAWYIEHAEEMRNYKDVDDIGAYCLCRLRRNGPPENIFLSRAFVGWGFVMDKYQWWKYARPAWFSGKGTWDTALAVHIRASGPSVCNAHPELSRVANTGCEDVGTWGDIMDIHVYNQSREAYNFRLTGIKSAAS